MENDTQETAALTMSQIEHLVDCIKELDKLKPKLMDFGYHLSKADEWLLYEFAGMIATIHKALGMFDLLAVHLLQAELLKPHRNNQTCRGLVEVASRDYAFDFFRVIADAAFREIETDPAKLVAYAEAANEKLLDILKNNPSTNELRYMYPPLGNPALVDVQGPRALTQSVEQRQALIELVRHCLPSLTETIGKLLTKNSAGKSAGGG